MPATITTNNHARGLVSYLALPESARAQFDYMLPSTGMPDFPMQRAVLSDWTVEHGILDVPRFFQYRGAWYDVQEFEAGSTPGNAVPAPWQAWQTQSAFDAIVIRYPFEWDGVTVDYDAVVVGHMHW